MQTFNKFVLIIFLCSVAIGIYGHYKLQKEINELKAKNENETQQEECLENNNSDNKEDKFLNFLRGDSNCNVQKK